MPCMQLMHFFCFGDSFLRAPTSLTPSPLRAPRGEVMDLDQRGNSVHKVKHPFGKSKDNIYFYQAGFLAFLLPYTRLAVW